MPIEDSGSKPDFSDDEKKAIKDSWSGVYSEYESTSSEILIKFFVDNPSAQDFFPKFKDLDSEEKLKSSTAVRWHAERIINAVNDAIWLLDEPEKNAKKLKELSEKHAVQLNVDAKFFKVLAEVILDKVAEKNDGSFSDSARSAWEKLLTYICISLKVAY
ncbi:globin-1-like [Lampetra fluviatilis]